MTKTATENATKNRSAATNISYRSVNGYHVFTSDDVRGLYVASKDAQKALESVGAILKESIDGAARTQSAT